MPAAEHIPDEDAIYRLIDYPRMYVDSKELIWGQVFQFPSNAPAESVVWGKYAPTPEDVHRLGLEREKGVHERKPGTGMRYVGFIPSTAGAVRAICTRPGHGFSVVHEPREGIHHAEISYKPAGERCLDQLRKNEKNELKLALRKAFGDLVPYSGA
jgi:hypothetical protein